MDNIDYFNNLDKESLENIIKSLPSNIFFKDLNGKYLFCSNFKDIKGDIIGKTSIDANMNKEEGNFSYNIDKEIIKSGMGTSYVRKIDNNGIIKYIEIIKNPVFDKDGNLIGISGLVNDITSRIILEEKLIDLANKDDLTGLYNRTYLTYWLQTRNKKELYPLSIFSIDCNRLKYINDNYGHLVGDQYLKNTADVLKLCFNKESVVSRIGGDEFLVISPNCSEINALDILALLKERSDSIRIFNNKLSFAVGYNTVDTYTNDLTLNIDNADKDMYSNKQKMKKMLYK